MTLAEMRTMLRTYVGNPTSTDVADSVLTAHLNRAYLYICDRHKVPQVIQRTTVPTVIGTSSYALQSVDTTVRRIWCRTYNYQLKKADPLMLQSLDTTGNSSPRTGRPTWYYRDKGNIIVFPTPDAVYSLEFITKIKPTALAADGDTPVLDELWHEGVVFLARWYFWDSILDYPKAQYSFGIWQNWVQTKPNELREDGLDLEEGVEIVGLQLSARPTTDFDYE